MLSDLLGYAMRYRSRGLPTLSVAAWRLTKVIVSSALVEVLGAGMDLVDYIGRVNRNTDFGFVIHETRHRRQTWAVVGQHALYEAVIRDLGPVIIRSRLGYALRRSQLTMVLSAEPMTQAPPISFSASHVTAVYVSDPWNKSWMAGHLRGCGFDYILSEYPRGFAANADLRFIRPEQVIHFPFCVPDWVPDGFPVSCRQSGIVAFGAGEETSRYELRNWIKGQKDLVESQTYSGDYNRQFRGDDYFRFLGGIDCAVAAVSEYPPFDAPVAKYFEIPAAGCLLLGFHCPELDELGFVHMVNCVMFTSRDEFISEAEKYLSAPQEYLLIRERGQDLIRTRHTNSSRIAQLRSLFEMADQGVR